jgi:hypothetical protein
MVSPRASASCSIGPARAFCSAASASCQASEKARPIAFATSRRISPLKGYLSVVMADAASRSSLTTLRQWRPPHRARFDLPGPPGDAGRPSSRRATSGPRTSSPPRSTPRHLSGASLRCGAAHGCRSAPFRPISGCVGSGRRTSRQPRLAAHLTQARGNQHHHTIVREWSDNCPAVLTFGIGLASRPLMAGCPVLVALTTQR